VQRDLVLRAQGGDHDAFTALAAASIDRLHRTARLILRDDERASDAVQEALTDCWLDLRAVRDLDRFDAWLNRLLVNACYRASERDRRRQRREVTIDAFDAPAPTDAARDFANRDQLDRAFRRLSPEQRAVLVVHHYLGMPDGDAAVSLGIPPGTFKSRLHRATSALRAAIDADERLAARTSESVA
jgi:RNA polymerase sigma-70 factor (ECF subfamily)